MDNDLIQDTNLDLLQVNAVEVEYSGIAPINVDNQEHTISLDPSALSSKLDTSAFDEWTATHSAGEEYSAGEGIDITDHVISYTGDPGDATPWISGNKIITSADYMQPGEFIQVLSSFDLSGNKNHFITVKGQGYYFPTNQQLKERVGVDEYLPLSSFSSYTASIASNLENNWNYTNSAYSQSLNNYHNKLDISAFSSWSSEHSGDYLTKESADTLYQPIGDYLTTADSGNFYPMEGNPSGFLTAVDLSNYYEKNETSSKEEISSAITSVENIINNLSGEYYPLTSNPSGYLTAHQSLDDYQKTADMTAYQPVGDYYSASNPSGFITGVNLTDYYQKNETSSKEEISDALTSKLDTTAFTSYTSNADTTEYTAGDNIDITNHVVSGKDWTSTIESATSGKLDTSSFTAYTATAVQGIEYTGIAPIDVNNNTHQISADVWTLSARNGISILEDAENKVTTLDFTGQPDLSNYYTKTDIQSQSANYYPKTGNPSGFLTAHQSLSNYYRKNDTSSKQQISAALNGKQNNLTFAGANNTISSINGSALAGGSETTAYSALSAQTITGAVLDYTRGKFRTLSSNEIEINDNYVIPKTNYYNVHETVIHSANGGTARTNDVSTNFVYNNVYDIVTGQIDTRYHNYTFGNNGEYIGYDTRIDVTLPFTATSIRYTACDTDYNVIYTGILTANEGKSDWTIEPTDFNIDYSNSYHSNQIAKIQIGNFQPVLGTTGVITAKLINAVDEVFATQPWVLSQLTGQGAGFPITGMDGSTVYSADCNGSSFNIRSQYSTTYFAPRSLYHAHSPSYGASAEYSDIIDVANTFVTAIPAQVVANSGLATGQNILYIVTGN